MTPREKLDHRAAHGHPRQKPRRILQEHRIEKLPLVDEKFRLCGLITMKDIKKAEQFPNACKDSHGRLLVRGGRGVSLDMEREELLH
jgi:IMP dehydrogenase